MRGYAPVVNKFSIRNLYVNKNNLSTIIRDTSGDNKGMVIDHLQHIKNNSFKKPASGILMDVQSAMISDKTNKKVVKKEAFQEVYSSESKNIETKNNNMKEYVAEKQVSAFTSLPGPVCFHLKNNFSKVVDNRYSNSALDYALDNISTISIHYGDFIVCGNSCAVSYDKKVKDFTLSNQFNAVQATVLTKMPINLYEDKSSGMGSLKNIHIELQPLAYINMKLEFPDCQVTSIKGLPPGIIFESGSIKGSPTVPGDYSIRALLTNGTYVPGKIKVHIIDRIL